MISSGGTSAWMTCVAMGIVLSVSSKQEQLHVGINSETLKNTNPISILSESI
jgi:cell division protein FtsW